MSAKRTVTCLRSPTRALFEVRIFSARCFGMYDSGLAASRRLGGERGEAGPAELLARRDGGCHSSGRPPRAGRHSSRRSARPRCSQPGTGDTSCQSLQSSVAGEGQNGRPRVTARVSRGQGHCRGDTAAGSPRVRSWHKSCPATPMGSRDNRRVRCDGMPWLKGVPLRRLDKLSTGSARRCGTKNWKE